MKRTIAKTVSASRNSMVCISVCSCREMSDPLAYDYPSDMPDDTYYLRQDVPRSDLDLMSPGVIACVPAKYFLLSCALLGTVVCLSVVDMLKEFCEHPRHRAGEPIKI